MPFRSALFWGRLRLKCDGTRAETRFRLSAKRTSPFKPTGASVQSTTGSRGVRISGNNAGYTMFRGSVKSTGYPLHSPVSPSLTLPGSPCAITFQLDFTTQRIVVIPYQISGRPYGSRLQSLIHLDFLTLEDGTDRLCPKRRLGVATVRFVIPWKSKDHI